MNWVLYLVLAIFSLFVVGLVLFIINRKKSTKSLSGAQENLRTVTETQETTIRLLDELIKKLSGKYPTYVGPLKARRKALYNTPLDKLVKDHLAYEETRVLRDNLKEGLDAIDDLGEEYISQGYLDSLLKKLL